MHHYNKIIAKLHIRIKRSHATLVSSLDCSFEPLSNGIHAAFRVLRDAGHDVWKHGETVHCARLVMMHSLQERSVKTKRLFLWFAERHQHAWLIALDRSKIDLGTGKRMLVHGGRLDRKFLITVPESLLNER